MTRNGTLFQLQPLVRRTAEIVSGLLATPTATANQLAPSMQKHPSSRAMWPTPTARDWKDNGKSPAELARNSKTLATHAGGKLNPQWVEWLMGFPIGWTDLDV